MVNRRQVLLVTNDLGPRAGGIESFILGLLGELDGSNVVIFTSSQDGDTEFDRELAEDYGVIVHRDKARILLPTPRVNRAVGELMEKYSSEIIWFGATAPLGWMSGYLKRKGAKRQVGLTHGHEVWWSKVWPFSWVLNRISRNLDVITYLGDFTLRAMKPALSPHVRTVQIAPGIAVNHFTPGEANQELIDTLNIKGKRTVICVGRLVHRKGQDRLIEAMPKILQNQPDVVLILVGEGPRKNYLLKLVKKLNIENSVRFVGRLHFDELPLYLRVADLFAMPSRSRFFGLEVEGLGIVYLEASAAGLSVLGGASGGAPDAVLVGETGYVVDGGSVDAIAERVLSMLADPEGLHRMGARGRSWAVERWSWKIWGEKFKEVLFGE